MNKQTIVALACVSCLIATAITLGCSRKQASLDPEIDSSMQVSVAIVEGTEPNDEQRQSMLTAKDRLFQRLSGRLMQVMGEQGPAAAIAVCQNEATDIAAEIGENEGLSIGRTGIRLRNPNNQPPTWAKPLTETRTDTPTFVTLSNGHAAALLPIKLQTQCLMCHGPTEQIAPVIAEQLERLYPEDQATGFQEGELRGWFWVEMH